MYSKTCLKWPLKKKTEICFQDRLSLNAGQKYCRMFQGEHSAILLTFIKLPFVINTFVLSCFEWPLKTGFTVYDCKKLTSWKNGFGVNLIGKFQLKLQLASLINLSSRISVFNWYGVGKICMLHV